MVSLSLRSLERRRIRACPRGHQEAYGRLQEVYRQLQEDAREPSEVRYPHGLLQLHADSRLDAQRPRLRAARRLDVPQLQRIRGGGLRPVRAQAAERGEGL